MVRGPRDRFRGVVNEFETRGRQRNFWIVHLLKEQTGGAVKAVFLLMLWLVTSRHTRNNNSFIFSETLVMHREANGKLLFILRHHYDSLGGGFDSSGNHKFYELLPRKQTPPLCN